MKKFDRLAPEQRRQEIQAAALQLFCQKGFAATTMENIVQQVSLSKGGVYRIYPSTSAILGDLMLQGMHLRNTYYEERVRQHTGAGKPLTMQFLVEMICDSLLLYPEISTVYVEFLWEKQRNPQLEELYQTICSTTVEETTALIRQYGAQELLLAGPDTLKRLTELMNAAVLSLHVLGLQQDFTANRERICRLIADFLKEEK